MAAPVLEFEVKGLDALLANLRALGPAMQNVAQQAVVQEAERINADAKQQVPYDRGELERSGTVRGWTEGSMMAATVGFGAGPSQPYALAVHEHLSEHSPRAWKGAEASGRGVHFSRQPGVKYLERPFLAATKGMADRIAAEIRTKIAGGGAARTTMTPRSPSGGGGL